MTNDLFVTKLSELIEGLSNSEPHFYTVALLKECRERIDTVKDLEVELAYYRSLCDGYELVLRGLGKGIIE